MPTYTRGVLRDQLTYVLVSSSNVYYGFNTKDFASIAGLSINVADLAAIGHLSGNNLGVGAIKMFGANSPKPPRVRKIVKARPSVSEQGSVSTYCAINKMNDAEGAGWQIVDGGRGITFTNNSRTKTMAAKLSNGAYYTFPMNTADANNNAAELGLEPPESMTAANRAKAFSGASKPRPAKVAKQLADGSYIQSFISTDSIDSALENGWALVKGEVFFGTAPAAS